MLPEIMRVYARHLEQFSEWTRRLLKHFTFSHLETLQLLVYVEKCTGSPRYEEISNLLRDGFWAAGGQEDAVPEFFSAEALAKLKQRNAKLRLRPRGSAVPKSRS